MNTERRRDDRELRRLQAEAIDRDRDIRGMRERERRQGALIARLRREAGVREHDLVALRERLGAAEHELEDLRATRDALTPPELPTRPGLELAAAFLPAAERVSGDFYLVSEGPQDATVLVVGDVVGHGLAAARRAAFLRTVFAATAPFSDDPCHLLSWANVALIERAGAGTDFVTAACVSYLPGERCLRWAYAGHPPALWLDDDQELVAPRQGIPLGLFNDPGCLDGSRRFPASAGVLLYTDGLTEARRGGKLFGLDGVTTALGSLQHPSATEAVDILCTRVADFASRPLADDLCLVAARMN
jgi:sigma-B regulation protein RsbU (phosphoserine phosphatase)